MRWFAWPEALAIADPGLAGFLRAYAPARPMTGSVTDAADQARGRRDRSRRYARSYAAEIHGSCDDRFAAVRDLLAASLAQGTDLGASVAVTLEGELVVDIWGGWADEARTRPWERDTITNVWSTTKTMTALCALMLVDAGELDLDAPVSTLLAGVRGRRQGGPGPVPPLDGPYRRAAGLVRTDDGRGPLRLGEGHQPARRPGAVVGAGHGVRLSRRHPGLPDRRGDAPGDRPVDRRVLPGERLRTTRRRLSHRPRPGRVRAGLQCRPTPAARARSGTSTQMALRTLANPPLSAEASWTDPWRQAEIPAANGHGNARSVATIQSVSPTGARRAESGSFPRRAAPGSSSSSPTATTWCWGCRSVWASVTGCPRRRCRS